MSGRLPQGIYALRLACPRTGCMPLLFAASDLRAYQMPLLFQPLWCVFYRGARRNVKCAPCCSLIATVVSAQCSCKEPSENVHSCLLAFVYGIARAVRL